MMQKFLTLLCCLLLWAAPCHAQVYVNQALPADTRQEDILRLTVFRTGESDCMLLEAGGEAMMIDGGAKKWRDPLWNALAERGVSHVKYLFNTHPHDDHIDGLYYMMQFGLKVDEFLSVFERDYDSKLHSRAVKEADAHGIPYRQLFKGDTLTLGGAALTVYRWDEAKDPNSASALTRLEYGGCSALLCADISGRAQRYFLGALPPEALRADVVKAPHHGITPFVSEFLTAVDPAFVWITNYNDKTMSRIFHQLKGRSLPMFFSGEGTVILESDGKDWYVRQTEGQF